MAGILNTLKAGGVPKVFEDRTISPTYVIDARKVDDGFDVLSARPVALQDVTPSYIRGAMRTQCANAFKLSEVELDALLASPPSAK